MTDENNTISCLLAQHNTRSVQKVMQLIQFLATIILLTSDFFTVYRLATKVYIYFLKNRF